ncbi:MAG: prephenate dehydrogenase [Nitrospirota bacterium]
MTTYNRMVIIGVGLIGGSLGIVCREKGIVKEIVGIGRGKDNLIKARELGIINRYTDDIREAVSEADIVVLATPIGAMEEIAGKITPFLKDGTIVTDVGSVKGLLVERMEKILSPVKGGYSKRGMMFVGGHPIAGRERSGVEAASGDLFYNTRCILTPTDLTNKEALNKVKEIWEEAGASVTLIDPFIHDRIMAVVSHLPHIAAYSLVNAAMDISIDKHDIVSFSAGGFKDFTRIAASSSEMWRDICLLNSKDICQMIDKYQEELERIKEMIINRDGNALIERFERAKEYKNKVKSEKGYKIIKN